MNTTQNVKFKYKVGEVVELNTAALFASPIRTDRWIKAEIKDRREGRYWMFHDCGSPLWVSDHMLRPKP